MGVDAGVFFRRLCHAERYVNGQVWKSYGEDGMAAVHPDDVEQLNAELSDFMASGEEQREFTYRIKGRWGIYLD